MVYANNVLETHSLILPSMAHDFYYFLKLHMPYDIVHQFARALSFVWIVGSAKPKENAS